MRQRILDTIYRLTGYPPGFRSADYVRQETGLASVAPAADARVRRKAIESGQGCAIKAVVILVCLPLAGCAGRIEGVLTPVAASQSSAAASTVTMLVATSRKPSGDPATLFSGERSPNLSLTDITVSIPAKRSPGTVQWPKKLPPDPDKEFAVIRAQSVSRGPEARKWFSQHNSNGQVLVFVHGFNNRYEDSVFRFAQIVHDSHAEVVPVLFTWPSRANVLDYNYDKESTNFSRTALEEGLRILADDATVKEVTVMAHSMGTWLAMEALRQMAIRDGKVAAKIKNVILASPDLDVDVFARQWWELGKAKPKITIFVSQDDRALKVSRQISGGVDRVGQINPAAEPYRSKLEAAGITVVDLTKLKTDDWLNHGKFAESPEIVQLVGSRLVTGQTLTDSDVSLGETILGAVNTVGQAAATTMTAPLVIAGGKTPPRQSDQTDAILAGETK